MLVACSEHLIGATGLRKPEIGVPGSVLSLVGNSGINTGNKCSRYQKRNSGKHKFGGENKFEVTAVLQILRELTFGWKEGCCVIEKKFGGGGGTSLEKNKTECYCYFYVYWRGFDVYSEGMCFSSTKHFYKYTWGLREGFDRY